jgi:hypothetical protein
MDLELTKAQRKHLIISVRQAKWVTQLLRIRLVIVISVDLELDKTEN